VFGIPEDDLKFFACHHKTNVKMMPTSNCLVALSESPFFSLNLDEIEVAFFERVSLQLKNFDIAFVLKDF
jgi:nucleosome binding factor SPN SPT16 subunit